MSKWIRTRRDPARTYIDEENKIRNARMVERMRAFLEEGTIDDEPAFVKAVKDAIPNIGKEELKKMIMQFRGVISERQRRGRDSR